MKYRTTQDIVIPAGTVLQDAPWRTIRGGPRPGPSGHVDAIMGHGKDVSSVWTIPIDDALAEGVIEPVGEPKA
jgi:hypothetical protein